MPYRIEDKGGGKVVVNTETGRQLSSKPLKPSVAESQFRLLEALEHDPNWKPDEK